MQTGDSGKRPRDSHVHVGGGGNRECDPDHPHHSGNVRADELATQGLNMPPPPLTTNFKEWQVKKHTM